jgi:formate dehydrogenase subunit gamma
MAARQPSSATRSDGASALRILRFDRVQRVAHWSNAVLFGICMLTALPLYFSQIERIVGRHVLVDEIHVWSGVALPVPLVISLVGPWGARMRRDLRRINRWTEQELRWLGTLGRSDLHADKFNPGQKLNAIFVGGAIVVMLGTGSIMKWFDLFPVGWRTGATFVHEVLALIVFLVVAGHIVLALTHRDSLRSMVRGWVTVAWARAHAPRWLDEMELGATVTAAPDDAVAAPATAPPAGTGAVREPPAS